MEVQYVVNNVFRYDVDKDGAVTYAQFVFFILFRPILVFNNILGKWLYKGFIKNNIT